MKPEKKRGQERGATPEQIMQAAKDYRRRARRALTEALGAEAAELRNTLRRDALTWTNLAKNMGELAGVLLKSNGPRPRN